MSTLYHKQVYVMTVIQRWNNNAIYRLDAKWHLIYFAEGVKPPVAITMVSNFRYAGTNYMSMCYQLIPHANVCLQD